MTDVLSPDAPVESAQTAEQAGEARGGVAHVTLNLPQLVWDTLSGIAAAQGVNKTEAVRRAISAYVFLHEAVEAGDKIVLVHKDGSSETVRIMY